MSEGRPKITDIFTGGEYIPPPEPEDTEPTAVDDHSLQVLDEMRARVAAGEMRNIAVIGLENGLPAAFVSNDGTLDMAKLAILNVATDDVKDVLRDLMDSLSFGGEVVMAENDEGEDDGA